MVNRGLCVFLLKGFWNSFGVWLCSVVTPWAHIEAFLILIPLYESHDKWQNRRSLKITPLSSSLLLRYSVLPAAFPQPGLRGGKIYKWASGRTRDIVRRARLTRIIAVIEVVSAFFAHDPQSGQEKVAPKAAAKCVFQLVMGVIMALPRKTIAFHPSWVLKRENESVEIARFLKRLQFGGSWSRVKHRAGWLFSAVVAKSSLASLGWGMMLLPISAVPSHPSLLSASCYINFLPLLLEE